LEEEEDPNILKYDPAPFPDNDGGPPTTPEQVIKRPSRTNATKIRRSGTTTTTTTTPKV
jgi:hypothetical protein